MRPEVLVESNKLPAIDPRKLAETHFPGPKFIRKIVTSLNFPFLAEKHGITYIGHTKAMGGNLFVRHNPRFLQLLISCQGCGTIWLDDHWVECPAGTAYITPANRFHAYFATKERLWEYSWIIFEGNGPKHVRSAASPARPYTKNVDPDLLASPIQGLCNEALHQHDEITMEAWVQLVNTYTLRALTGRELDPRLRRLWLRVQDDIGFPWDCVEMARIAQVSEEHLRRLCQQAYSQTPLKRLTALRMRSVAEQLTYSNLSIESIAESVGYSDAGSLARVFQRHQRISPAQYRRQIRTQPHEVATTESNRP